MEPKKRKTNKTNKKESRAQIIDELTVGFFFCHAENSEALYGISQYTSASIFRKYMWTLEDIWKIRQTAHKKLIWRKTFMDLWFS